MNINKELLDGLVGLELKDINEELADQSVWALFDAMDGDIVSLLTDQCDMVESTKDLSMLDDLDWDSDLDGMGVAILNQLDNELYCYRLNDNSQIVELEVYDARDYLEDLNDDSDEEDEVESTEDTNCDSVGNTDDSEIEINDDSVIEIDDESDDIEDSSEIESVEDYPQEQDIDLVDTIDESDEEDTFGEELTVLEATEGNSDVEFEHTINEDRLASIFTEDEDDSSTGVESENSILDRVRRPEDTSVLYQDNGKTLSRTKLLKYLISEDGGSFDFMTIPGETKKDNIVVRYFNGGAYIVDENLRTVGKVVDKILGDLHETDITERVGKLINKRYSYGELGTTKFPAYHPKWINVKNGMLNIVSAELIPHSDFYDKYPNQKSIIQLSVDYNEDADSSEFMDYLRDKVDSDVEANFICEFFGLSLIQWVEHQKFLVFIGGSDTGKSTILNILEEILGNSNYSNTSLSKIDGRGNFGLSELYCKLANINHEASAYELAGSGNLKSVVDGGLVEVEKKFQNPIKRELFATVIGASNLPIKYKVGDDSGFDNRLLVVPFNNSHKGKADPRVKDNLKSKANLEGAFLEFFKGLRRVLSRGRLVISPAMERAKDINTAGEDDTYLFAVKYLEKGATVDYNGKTYNARQPAWEIYRLYKQWMAEQNKNPLSEIKFYREIKDWSGSVKKLMAIFGWDRKDGSGRPVNTQAIEGVILSTDGELLAEQLKYQLTDYIRPQR